MASEQERLYEAGELLAEELADNKVPGVGGFLIFEKLGWDKRKIQRETSRIKSVREWQKIAGTPAQLEQARESAALAANRADERCEQWQAEIAELQNQIDIETRVKQTNIQALAERERAIEALRSLIPEYVKRRHNMEVKTLNESPAAVQLRDVQGKIRKATKVIAIDPTNVETIKNYVCNQLGESEREKILVRIEGHGVGAQTFSYGIRDASWADHVAELKSGLPGLEQEAERLSVEVDARQEHCDELLNHYFQ